MVHSHMALYTGGEVKYSMQSPPWSTHLLQLWQRKELEGAAAGGQAINSKGGHGCLAPLHQNHCQSTGAGDGFCPSKPSSKDKLQHHRTDP